MSVVKGYDGSLDFGALIDSDTSYRTHSWTLDVSADTQDVTDFTSEGWREFVSTLKAWSGSCELFVDSVSATQIQPSDIGSSATIKMYINNADYLYGSAIVSGWNPATDVQGVATQSLSFQGTSDLFYTST